MTVADETDESATPGGSGAAAGSGRIHGVTAVIAAGISVAAAGLIALAGWVGGLVLAAAVMFAVVALAAGWGALLRLPHASGSAVLVGGTGLVSIGVATAVADQARPLSAFAGVIAGAVLAAFGHELLRRDGRAEVVASVTGTLAGQAVAVLAAGWILLLETPAGWPGVLVAAVAVGSARLATALPWRLRITAWIGFAFGIAGAGIAAVVAGDLEIGTAAVIGVTVAAAVAALDRLLSHDLDTQHPQALLAAAAAPVAAAGTVAYAAVRLLIT